MDFKDKVVLILGGTGGIGGAIADAFEKSNAIVCRHALSGGEYGADVGNEAEIVVLVKKVVDKFGKIDILINSVGHPAHISVFEKKKWEDFLSHLNVQLKSAVIAAQSVLPIMKEAKWGRIIHVLSSYTKGNIPSSLSDYVTAKYALLGFTKALAKEVGKDNITVNALSPSFIKNDFTKNIPDKFSEILISNTPIRRLCTHEDVANAVLFLASEKAGFITGENLSVTGGNDI